MTPMMEQFYQIKRQYPDSILFYRMGDFYEMFGDDAVVASKILQIQLTTRNKNKGNNTPMCGIPIHAFEQYLNKLTKSGHKVAICEQMEDPLQAKGLVRRGVVRVITPGTVIASDLLDSNRNNYVCSLCFEPKKSVLGIAFCDLSTGEFDLDQLDIKTHDHHLFELLYYYNPREIIIPKSNQAREKSYYQELIPQLSVLFSSREETTHIEHLEAYVFEYRQGDRLLREHYRISSLAGFGLDNLSMGISSAGALLWYLQETQKDSLPHLQPLKRIQQNDKMLLDEATIRNLELFESSSRGAETDTLIHLLDNTKTAMGARLLRRWMAAPLINKDAIEERLSRVESLIQEPAVVENLRLVFRSIGDLERIITRIVLPGTSIPDLVRLRHSLEAVRKLPQYLAKLDKGNFKILLSDFDDLQKTHDLLVEQLMEEPCLKIKEGGFIKTGVNEQLDKLKSLMKNGKQHIANLEAKEKKETGITTLKVKYNRIFGYFFEVSNTFKHKIPANYIRKQTLVNNERFITEELKELEESIISAEDESITLELELFRKIKSQLQEQISKIQKTAKVIAELDVLSAFCHNAMMYNYTRPELQDVEERQEMLVTGGRHPVIESLNLEETFVPNDIHLNSQGNFISVITGPNMGGKSTYMRQKALIALLAQIGSYVPATRAKLSVFDRIFTRVGASDNLTRGQSTFMVEMSEAASILNNATSKSLIILDEIGRGTSTFDGISLAWSIVEHLHEIKALTLFATHYHELVLLEEQLPGVSNAKVVVNDDNGKIVFLRKVVPGKADKSYGIQVADLAGIPDNVIKKAKKILLKLERAERQLSQKEDKNLMVRECSATPDYKKTDPVDDGQISFMSIEEPLIRELREMDLLNTTPFQALQYLIELQKKL